MDEQLREFRSDVLVIANMLSICMYVAFAEMGLTTATRVTGSMSLLFIVGAVVSNPTSREWLFSRGSDIAGIFTLRSSGVDD